MNILLLLLVVEFLNFGNRNYDKYVIADLDELFLTGFFIRCCQLKWKPLIIFINTSRFVRGIKL